jgi:hypothetical protein
MHRKKYTQCHIVQEEQSIHVINVARSAKFPTKALSERNLLQGVNRVDFWLSVKEVILKGARSKCRRNILRNLEVLRRNKLRRDSGWKLFSREEPTENFPINEQDPSGGIEILTDHEIWECCMEDSLKIL